MESIMEISAAMSVLILLMLILTPVLRRWYSSRLQYIIWLIIAVRLCIPININLPSLLIAMFPQQHTAVHEIQNNAGTDVVLNTDNDISTPVPPVQIPERHAEMNILPLVVRSVLFDHYIWLTGALIFFMYHIISYLNFRRRIRRCLKETDIKCRLKVYICGRIASPMMIGFFRPIILLPEIDYTSEEIEFILAHEMTHFKRGDLWYKLLLITANAVHFFNPLVYIMRRYADRNLEYVCDEEVCKNKDTDFKKAYSMTILKSMKNKNSAALSGNLSGEGKNLHKRFENIFLRRRKRGVLPAVAMLIISLSVCSLISIEREYSLTSISSDDVGVITVFDGNTGREINITDKEQTEHIINSFNNTKMYRSGLSLGRMGYSLRVTIYRGNMKKYKTFILNSPTLIRDDPFFYTAPNAVDYYYIKDLFLPEESDGSTDPAF